MNLTIRQEIETDYGFATAANWGIKSLFDVPDEYFMALELVPGALKGVSGTVIYPMNLR